MAEATVAGLSFPRLSARTLRFTLGVPRAASVTADGARVLFVRTPSGTSRTGALWAYDVEGQQERLLADPAELLGDDEEELSPAERARRERAREAGAGVVSFATGGKRDELVCFALSGQLWVAATDGSTPARRLPSTGPVIDPRLDPTGTRVAYASDGALRIVAVDGDGGDRVLVEPEGPDVTWGQAEFVAAEEMDRLRGYWWAPDGRSLLVQRTDDSAVPVWHIADPANPSAVPVAHRYPAAGATNADVSLWHFDLAGSRTRITWDAQTYEYLTRVSWTSHGDPVIQVMGRDQKRAQVLGVDPDGDTRLLREQSDAVWVDLFAGVPTMAPGGRLVTVEDSADTHRVVVDGVAISPERLQVAGVLGCDDTGVLISGTEEPIEMHLVHVGWDGTLTRLTEGQGMHLGGAADGTTVITRSSLDAAGSRVTVTRAGSTVELANHAVPAGFSPRVSLLRAGERELRTAVLFPADHEPGSARLPVLMHPYAGPHALRCVASARAFLEPQWLADQGFCVVVADGRGTPSRGPAWERSIRDDLAGVTLADQVDALAAVAAAHPDDVDTSRVAISGWSYGGYISALAVLARPDVFHAAVAGAPVTEMELYDTFYTERYLGHPGEQPEVYTANSLTRLAPGLERPLMIIHGMVDDNVVVAHTLRLSSALLAAGRPHEVLPLTGVTHMTSQETVAENLALLQVEFLRRALG
ncbi:MAG: prolyl oligopeptidase family serine peptidase [Actinomycetota bacterium]|nr:prolyl oligopeptidase family serine peptidase [Actinomycetota bacterium]